MYPIRRPPWPFLVLVGLTIAGGVCVLLGWYAPGVWLITAGLVAYALILAYGFWDAFIKPRH